MPAGEGWGEGPAAPAPSPAGGGSPSMAEDEMRPHRRSTSTRRGGSMRSEDTSDLFSSRTTASCMRKAVGAIYCVLLARFAFRVSRANSLGTRSDPVMGAVPLRGRPPRSSSMSSCVPPNRASLSLRPTRVDCIPRVQCPLSGAPSMSIAAASSRSDLKCPSGNCCTSSR